MLSSQETSPKSGMSQLTSIRQHAEEAFKILNTGEGPHRLQMAVAAFKVCFQQISAYTPIGCLSAAIRELFKGKSQAEKNRIAIKVNIAENADGQRILKELSDSLHISVIRQYPHPNAVYLCPWPYRPTAVVQGVLQPWAIELAEREGFQLNR